MAKNAQLFKILAIVGCFIAIIGACLSFWATVWLIIGPILTILLAVLILAAKGIIPLKKKLLPDTWTVFLIVGIVFIVFYIIAMHWLVLIGGILLAVSACLDHFT